MVDRILRHVVTVTALVTAFLLGPAPAYGETTPTFVGHYHYAGGATEEAARKVAIDRAIDGMFFAIRPIARYRMNNATRTPAWVSFTFEGGKIRTRGPDSLDLQTPDGGTIVHVWRGETTRATQRVAGNGLVQRFIADEAACHNEWSLSPDGATITVKMTITSPHLPKALVYSLTYRRDS